MNTVMGEALQKALDAKKNDYSNFVWKGDKRKVGDKFVQNSIRIIDMSLDEIKKAYNHCNKMLYSDDPKHLGRYNVLKEVNEQINKCNTELFIRFCKNSYLRREEAQPMNNTQIFIAIKNCMANTEVDAKERNMELDWDTISITHMPAIDIPTEFEDVTFTNALDGCTDNLGVFNKQHLTMTFITKMGLWFTKAEESEFKGLANNNIEKLRLAKERLHLPSSLVLRLSEKGLSYHEMRAMLVLPKKQKYADMSTEQLLTLRNKILLRLQREIDSHIFSWNRLKKQLELVALDKGINLANVF